METAPDPVKISPNAAKFRKITAVHIHLAINHFMVMADDYSRYLIVEKFMSLKAVLGYSKARSRVY
jgi:hypothetical protein